MKTICFYFQVHQPWRLKRYRFFDMGRDHNYLDDLTNRSIMQKVALKPCRCKNDGIVFAIFQLLYAGADISSQILAHHISIHVSYLVLPSQAAGSHHETLVSVK